MTELITRSGTWLLQQAAAPAADRGWFETVTSIADGVMTLTLLVLAIFLAPAAWSFWRTFRRVQGMLDRVYADINPITRHASRIADNLDYITTSIRHDVAQVNATIASANERVQEAVALTEQRLTEFNALLHVVQQEAEQAFVSTAAAVRGVRTGAATFTGLRGGEDDDDDTGGYEDGNDDESDTVAGGHERREAPARPRLRSRRQRRD